MDDSAAQTAEILVVGAGIAAHRFVTRMLEDPERAVRITVFGDEGRLPYDRSGLARLVAGASASGIDLDRGPFRDDRVRLIDDDRVLRIDRAGRRVRTRSRRWFGYDTLVLATGTHALRIEVPGVRARGSFALRTMDDAHGLRAFLAVRKTELPRALRAVVVGGDEAGLDVALALNETGVQTTLVDTADRLLPAVLSVPAAVALRRAVEARGIAVRPRTRLTRVDPDESGAVAAVEFQDGTFARTDLVVTTCARARDELARNAGLPVRPGGGVVVDAAGRTEDPRILAIGDVAFGADDLERGVEAARTSADRAAAALCGAPVAARELWHWRGAPGGIDIAVTRIEGVRGAAFVVPLPHRDRPGFGEVLLSADARRVHGTTVIGEPGETGPALLSEDDVDRRAQVRLLLGGGDDTAEDSEERCGHGFLSLPAEALRTHLDRHGIRTFAEALAAAGESRDCGPCLRRLAVALLQRAETEAAPSPVRRPGQAPEIRVRAAASGPVVEAEVGTAVDATLLLAIGRLAVRHGAVIGLGEGTITLEGLREGDLPEMLADLRAVGAVTPSPEARSGEAAPPVTTRAGSADGASQRRREAGRRHAGSAPDVRSAKGSA